MWLLGMSISSEVILVVAAPFASESLSDSAISSSTRHAASSAVREPAGDGAVMTSFVEFVTSSPVGSDWGAGGEVECGPGLNTGSDSGSGERSEEVGESGSCDGNDIVGIILIGRQDMVRLL